MSLKHRDYLLKMVYALSHYLMNTSLPFQQKVHITEVLNIANTASRHVTTDIDVVKRIMGQLCAGCGHKMHCKACNMDSWLQDCTLLKAKV